MSDVAPHKCPLCNSPAYLPFSGGTRCTSTQCEHHDKDLWVEFILEELPDEPQVELDLEIGEDEPTQPQLKFADLFGDTLKTGRLSHVGPTTGAQVREAMDKLDDLIDEAVDHVNIWCKENYCE